MLINRMLIALLIFPGCVTKQHIQKDCNIKTSCSMIQPNHEVRSLMNEQAGSREQHDGRLKQTSVQRMAQQYEAKCLDVSIPLRSQCVAVENDQHGQLLLRYSVPLSCSKVEQFYRHEMERSGWMQDIFYDGSEKFLTFSKPGRWCALMIQKKRKKNSIFTLMIGIKK